MNKTNSPKAKSSKAKKRTPARKSTRKIINVKIIEADISYGTLDKAIERLTLLKTEYCKVFSELRISNEQNPYDDGHTLWLEGSRPETDAETHKRVECELRQEEYQRRNYEELKKKFE